MSQSFRTLTRTIFACVCIVSFTAGLRAQVLVPGQWPTNWSTCPNGSIDAFQILYSNGALYPCQSTDAAMRITLGGSIASPNFGQLGVVDTLHYPFSLPRPAEWFSAFAPMYATVLRSSEGDLVLSATTFATFGVTPKHGPVPLAASPVPLTASIRFGTTPSDTLSTTAEHPAEIERAEILGNGNFGIDLPPDPITRLGNPMDQVQIGGGMIPPLGSGYTSPIPGLTIYGGNRYEGMPDTGGVTYPVDWRYIGFNNRTDHSDPSSNRYSRIAPMSSSVLDFSDGAGGLIQMNAYPYNPSRGMHDFTHGVSFEISGNEGLQMWSYEGSGNPYHHLFDVWRPGQFVGKGTLSPDSIRNDSGLFIHYTPVYIGFGQNWQVPNFTQLANVHPRLGDGKTWMLAVKGPALFQEAYVSIDWPDFVFDPQYQLMPLGEVEKYIEINHHLPGVPSADEMEKTGVPLGATEAKMMQKIEELTKYAIEQNKKIEKLEADIQELKNQKEK